jgi:hypothetical protein
MSFTIFAPVLFGESYVEVKGRGIGDVYFYEQNIMTGGYVNCF